MNKIFSNISAITIVLACTLPYTARCQAVKGQTELKAGIGIQSLYNLAENSLARGSIHYYSYGIYNVSWRYYLRRKFTIGANLSYEYVSGKHTNVTREMIITLAPEATFSYMDRPVGEKKLNIRLYWLAGIGVSSYKDLHSGSRLDFFPQVQLTPIGMRMGRTLGGYAEIGIGYKGILNLGVSYRMGKTKSVKAKQK